MKQSLLLVNILLFVAFTAFSQDYYSGKKTVRANTITYIVDGNGSFYGLENINNTLLHNMPYNTKKKEYYTDKSMPFTHAIQSDIEKIVLPILNPQNTPQNIGITIIMAVEPKSKTIKEIEYHLWPDKNEKILSIPPTTFEDVDKNLVGQKVGNIFLNIMKMLIM